MRHRALAYSNPKCPKLNFVVSKFAAASATN
jgi:hypothetical protein